MKVIIQKLQRNTKLTGIIGRLILLATDSGNEYDTFLDQIDGRITFFENQPPVRPKAYNVNIFKLEDLRG